MIQPSIRKRLEKFQANNDLIDWSEDAIKTKLMSCTHQFIKTNEWSDRTFVTCALCGQVRSLTQKGAVEVVVEEGVVSENHE